MTELTPERFDIMVTGRSPQSERPVWTLPAIGRLLGIGVDGVRSLMRVKGCPIRHRAGRYYAYPSELHAWLKDAA